MTVIVPVANLTSAHVWTITYYYPKYRFVAAASLIGDTVVYIECNTYPAHSTVPYIADANTGKVLVKGDSNTDLPLDGEFMSIAIAGIPDQNQMILYISKDNVALLDNQLHIAWRFNAPYSYGSMKLTAIDEDAGILYAWTYGLAGGMESQLFAVRLTDGVQLYNFTLGSNDWDGVESLVVVPGVGVLASSASITYSPFEHDRVTMISQSGEIMWTLSKIDFVSTRVIGLSNGTVAIARRGHAPYISVIDAKTGLEVKQCPGIPNSFMDWIAVETTDGYTVLLYTYVVNDYSLQATIPYLGAVACLV